MALTLTTSAAERVRGYLDARKETVGVRVGVKPSGCSGLSYIMDFAKEIGADDVVFEAQGVTLLVDKESLPFLEGMELDYTKEGLNEGFKFNNPNVKSTCGCGTSFSV